jgi:hypothetical protein
LKIYFREIEIGDSKNALLNEKRELYLNEEREAVSE